MKRFVHYGLIVFLVLGFIQKTLTAQIIIQTAQPPEELAELIVGEEIQISNAIYQGANISNAIFHNGNTTNLGLDEGILLYTGDPYFITGPNLDCNNVWEWNNPGHPLLDAIQSQGETRNATFIEFDVIPETDTLKFRYVFASEQYNDAGLFFSDVFGCFITGTDPNGGTYNKKNIAVLPGTNTSIEVYNINNGYAPCGIIPTGPCTNCEYYLDNTNGLTIEFNGFTIVLEAWAEVVPCENYHIFIGIADGGPMGWSTSGVFIESSTFKSPRLDISVEPSASDTIVQLVEGCNGTDLIFKLPDVDFAPITAYLDYSQSTANPLAFPDGDFLDALPTEITFEEGEDSLSIHLAPVDDGISEGDELLRIIVEYNLTCNPKYDTIDLLIIEYVAMGVVSAPDKTICAGDSVNIWIKPVLGAPPYNIQWSGIPVNNDTITVNPSISTWFTYTVTDQCQDTVIDSILVNVIPIPIVDLGPDTSICTGESIILQTQTGVFENYIWSTGDSTASITVTQPGTYWLQIINSCGEDEGEIVIEQWLYPNPNLGPDLELCYGQTAFLQATTGFVLYTWQDNSTEDFYTITQSGLYFVSVEDIHGCTGSDSVLAFIGNIVQLEDSLVLCEGSTTTIHANPGFDYYSWSTGQTETDSIIVIEEGWYNANVSYAFGCPSEDSTFVEEIPIPIATIAGDNMLCEGDTLWLDATPGNYEYYWNNVYSVSNQLMVNSGGNYTLKMVNACGEDEDSKFIQFSLLPEVDLGVDILLFPGESVNLNAGSFQSYAWNNDPGLNGQYYTIDYSDIDEQDSIWVEVFDGFCQNSDDIIIEIFNVQVPIVFTPNGDGYNDKFQPIEDLNGISNHKVMVFNRWGETIWESSDFNSGWDGKRNGQLVTDGTYYWILEVWYGKENSKKKYKGSLTVLGVKN